MSDSTNIAQAILGQGFIDVKVFVSGLRQSHRLQVVREDTPHGEIPFLISKYYIPIQELMRLAEQLQLPIKHKDTVVYPKGKAASDFASRPVSSIRVEQEVIEAEIED